VANSASNSAPFSPAPGSLASIASTTLIDSAGALRGEVAQRSGAADQVFVRNSDHDEMLHALQRQAARPARRASSADQSTRLQRRIRTTPPHVRHTGQREAHRHVEREQRRARHERQRGGYGADHDDAQAQPGQPARNHVQGALRDRHGARGLRPGPATLSETSPRRLPPKGKAIHASWKIALYPPPQRGEGSTLGYAKRGIA